jgi:hypothetical protein
MTAQQLLDGFTWINDRFYSLRSIARRLSRSPTGLYWTLPLNLRYLYAWRSYGAGRQAGTGVAPAEQVIRPVQNQ